MKTNYLMITSYTSLLVEIKTIVSEGLERAKNAYDKEKIITYWNIGKNIQKYFIRNKVEAESGKGIIENLARDLNISKPLLYQMTHFYNTHPELDTNLNLKWSHYRLLSSVKEKRIRQRLAKLASSQNLSERRLRLIQKEQSKPQVKVKSKKLTDYRGKLYQYKIFKPNYSDSYFIDLGFKISRKIKEKNFKNEYIQSFGTNTDYEIQETKVKRKDLYVYKALIEKIIDGDTIWMNIDLGFDTWIRHKVRLNGIDTPPIETIQGQKAFKYIEKELTDLPFLIVKSHGRDKFGRYLMDIFYLKGEDSPEKVLSKGIFLNQSLLDCKFANILL